MTNTEITQAIKEYASEIGMDLIGIASVESFAEDPERNPKIVFPECKSVISFGIKFLNSDMKAIRGENGYSVDEDNYGFVLMTKMLLADLTVRLTIFIEKEFSVTVVPASFGVPGVESLKGKDDKPFVFSQRKAAIAAGLGQMGWMGKVVTPKYGPRVVWGSIFTDIELDEDKPMDAPILCDPVTCRVCSDVCPIKAIKTPDKDSLTIEEYGLFVDTAACKEKCIIKKDITARQVHERCLDCGNYDECEANGYLCDEAKSSPVISGEDFTKSDDPYKKMLTELVDWKCGKCIAFCPIGRK